MGSGTRLGHVAMQSARGNSGMGERRKTKDTQLGPEVSIGNSPSVRAATRAFFDVHERDGIGWPGIGSLENG